MAEYTVSNAAGAPYMRWRQGQAKAVEGKLSFGRVVSGDVSGVYVILLYPPIGNEQEPPPYAISLGNLTPVQPEPPIEPPTQPPVQVDVNDRMEHYIGPIRVATYLRKIE